ncbi:MAG: YicC/YloC family endoribonuclease [Thermoanaerobaculia bacterium]
MRSMTGYGHAAAEGERYRLRVTLRSVNHRFLDVVLRLDDRLRGSEPALRELLGSRLSRGRVEVRVEAEGVGVAGARLEVDRELLAQLSLALEGLLEEELIERGLTAGDLVRHPQLLRISEPETGWEAQDEALLLEAAEEALAELVEARETEGAKLAVVLAERLAALARTTGELRELAAGDREETLATLRERVNALLEDQTVDEARLAQEVALLAERADVREELDRLQAHVEHFRELMSSGAAVGKRLDFLSQEILRELNTVGAKCRSAPMTRAVLDGKVLCEQLREQVQNVE